MRSTRTIKLLCLFVAAISLLALSMRSAFADNVYVTVRQTALRDKPLLFASTLAALKYGDQLEMLTNDKGWLHVRNKAGVKGYLHQSAVSSRKVVLKASASGTATADPSEILVAGKGFNAQVEKEFANKAKADFGKVNEVEKIKVSDADLRAFLINGKLKR